MAPHPSPPPQEPCVPPPNWLDLPADVSASIFRRLDMVDILTSVQYVCPTWRRICRDPSMWRSIDINFGSDFRNITHDLTKLYQLAVDLSSGGLLNVNMECATDSDGDLLFYMANRSNQLRRLRLVHWYVIPYDQLIEVAGNFPFLEELDLSYCNLSSEVVASFGRLCPRLYSFKLNDWGSRLGHVYPDLDAFAIAENMPGLRHLQIFGNRLTNVGLIAILDGCQQLESLDLRQCFHVSLDADLERRCTQCIKHFRGPNDSTDDYPFDSSILYDDILESKGYESGDGTDSSDEFIVDDPNDVFSMSLNGRVTFWHSS